MKKVLLLLIGVFCCVQLSAQTVCNPDTTLADSVIISPLPFEATLRPDGGITDTACLNTYYETVFNFQIPDTLGITGFMVPLDSVVIAAEGAINNLPDGMDYVCNPPNCVFPSDTVSCLQIQGTPTNAAQIGRHDLELTFTVHGVVINLPVAQQLTFPDTTGQLPENTQGNYFLFVKEEGSENCFPTTSTDDFVQQNLTVRNVPNPFSRLTDIQINSFISDRFNFKVHDMMGRELHRRQVRINEGENILSFDGSQLADGIYIYSLSNEKGIISSRMVLNRR